jgi:GNAT superfamily N-acetyltransferase
MIWKKSRHPRHQCEKSVDRRGVLPFPSTPFLMAFQTASSSAIPRLPVTLSSDSAGAGGSFGTRLSKDSSRWSRFSWKTDSLGAPQVPASGADLIRRATREEGEDVLHVILLSLAMDSGWNDSLQLVEEYAKASVARIFNAEEPLCLVIPKGNRLIAASLLDPTVEALNHLVSGPSVLMEYRNRGIGSRLLHASLSELRERGITSALGVTRDKTIAARYVYPKFGSVAAPVEFSALLDGVRENKGLKA